MSITLQEADHKTIINTDDGLAVNTEEIAKIIFDSKEMWDVIYPVGSIYISIAENPNNKFTGTTWTQMVGGALFATEEGGGAIIDGELPRPPSLICESAGEHTHTVNGSRSTGYYIPNGSYYGKDETTVQTTSANGSHTHNIWHNESNVYKRDDEMVIPTSFSVKVWQRTA